MGVVAGQPSIRLASDCVEAYVTELGGHLGPVTFDLAAKQVQPFHVAPWAEDPPTDIPNILGVLRGDFFCMPFGGNDTPFGGEKFPVHGETANELWTVDRKDDDSVVMSLDTRVRKAHVTKTISLRPGETAIYSEHRISGMSGPMTYGHHAMVAFKSPGLISTAPFVYGQVFPGQFEDPALGGYSSLKPGARFDRLDRVLQLDGKRADLTSYPAREGFEDLVMLVSKPGLPFGWSAVVFPEEGYLWLSLKNPKALPSTILWHSNGGRHYAPWNGRHRAVLGIEEVCSWFHAGLAESVAPNPISKLGYPTHSVMLPGEPAVIRTIMAVAPIREGFDQVASVVAGARGVVATSRSGIPVHLDLDLAYLN